MDSFASVVHELCAMGRDILPTVTPLLETSFMQLLMFTPIVLAIFGLIRYVAGDGT